MVKGGEGRLVGYGILRKRSSLYFIRQGDQGFGGKVYLSYLKGGRIKNGLGSCKGNG